MLAYKASLVDSLTSLPVEINLMSALRHGFKKLAGDHIRLVNHSGTRAAIESKTGFASLYWILIGIKPTIRGNHKVTQLLLSSKKEKWRPAESRKSAKLLTYEALPQLRQ